MALNVGKLTKEDYLSIDEVEFRARFRERVHHTLEIQTYAAIHDERKLSPGTAETVSGLVKIWKERGLPEDAPEFRWAQRILGFSEAAVKGEKVDLTPYAPHPVSAENLQAFENIIRERRSVRHWTDEEVPDEVIDKLLEAGLWAAHSCNLQSIRYIVIKEKNEPRTLVGNIPGAPVHIVILQDERVYRANPHNPVRNRLLDAGAAAQNIVLAAHALGLGGVWLTFDDKMLEKLYKRFNLPEEVKIVTYVDVGYPDQAPAPIDRLSVKEALIERV